MEFDAVVNRIGKGNVVNTILIPGSVKPNWEDARLITLKKSMRKKLGQPEIINSTEKNELNNEKNGLAVIPNVSEKPNTPTTLINPQPSYQQHLESLDLVGSESVKLIDESAKHLHERMLKTGSVVEAALCATQIVKLIKLKLDIRIATRE